jgi:hypothetical protein
MKALSLARVREIRGARLMASEAQAIIGNQPRYAVRNMSLALSMMTVLNTAEDWRRLEAALIWLRMGYVR